MFLFRKSCLCICKCFFDESIFPFGSIFLCWINIKTKFRTNNVYIGRKFLGWPLQTTPGKRPCPISFLVHKHMKLERKKFSTQRIMMVEKQRMRTTAIDRTAGKLLPYWAVTHDPVKTSPIIQTTSKTPHIIHSQIWNKLNGYQQVQ